MKKVVRVTTKEDIVQIVDYVHDEENDLDNIHFDTAAKTLTLPCQVHLWEEKRKTKKLLIFSGWEYPIIEAALVLKNVLKFEINDKAGVGGGLINTIHLKDNFVTIECTPPAEIKAEVSKFELELHVTDKLVKWS